MVTRSTRWIVLTAVPVLVAGLALAEITLPFTLIGPTPNALLNVPYSSAITVSGSSTVCLFSITAGSLPTGLNLNTTTGAITGTPTVVGQFPFTITATDNCVIVSATRPSLFAQTGNPTASGSGTFTITVSS